MMLRSLTPEWPPISRKLVFGSLTGTAPIIGMGGLYVVAKLFEHFDPQIAAAVSIGGHPLNTLRVQRDAAAAGSRSKLSELS